MISVVFDKFKNKKTIKVLVLFLFLTLAGLFSHKVLAVEALDGLSEMAEIDGNLMAGVDVVGNCKALLNAAGKIPCTPVGTDLDCGVQDSMINFAQSECRKAALDEDTKKEVEKLIKNAALRDKIRESLALSFKSALRMFSRQVAHDTAIWVASGGKGQKPLFITEGWGVYLKNTADVALGEFIDGIGTSFGMDLCQPDFRVKLLIRTSLDYNKIKTTRCSFSKIMDNWESAISSASFAVDYRNSLRSGQNDISYMLIMADRRNSYIADQVKAAEGEGAINDMWKSIKNTAGVILTPGTVIANWMRDKTSGSDTTLGWSTFTNTAADVVEEFANTLVSQLLTNLQTGLFSSSGSGNSSRNSLIPDPETIASLFDFSSSPLSRGSVGAKERFSSLITNNEKVGNRYDLLVKLANCSDNAKSNPGPTDCVLDTEFANQIRDRVYVNNLPEKIKKRVFSPQINQQNSLENEIPYRTILILRKYRIVPVGWEIAANLIKQDGGIVDQDGNPISKNWTLQELTDCYYGFQHNGCPTNSLKNLVDPYWVLKSYEAFCRREGYGAHNSDALSQDDSISRSDYCSDEQQCLFDDDKGNCQAYGYCTEERRLWDIGTKCDPRYNTCQTYKSRSGNSASLLKSTLNFTDCFASNVGCRAFALEFNVPSSNWNGDFLDSEGRFLTYSTSTSPIPITIVVEDNPDWYVKQYQTVSQNSRLKLSSPCSPELCDKLNYSGVSPSTCTFVTSTDPGWFPGYCKFNDGNVNTPTAAQPYENFCTIPLGGISCIVESCFDKNNILSEATHNNGFENSVDVATDADLWSDELSYLNLNNRHYRDTTKYHNGLASLKVLSAGNLDALKTSSTVINLESRTNYNLKFWTAGYINAGSVKVRLSFGADVASISELSSAEYTLTGNLGNWKERQIQFNSNGYAAARIEIISTPGTVSELYLDDFSLHKITTQCAGSALISLFNTTNNNTVNQKNIYLDRDAGTCSSKDDGCSMFLRNKAGVGGNLIYNGGFENGLDGWPAANLTYTENKVTILNGAVIRNINVDAGDYYAVSFEAAKPIAVTLTINKDDITESNCQNGNQIIFTPSGQDFERRSCYFRVKSNVASINLEISGSGAYIDNFKLAKVNLNDLQSIAATSYTRYEGSQRPANQVAYLKKAPDYFNCYRTNNNNWPETDAQLNEVNARKHEMCSQYSQVCLKKEAGCELYKPENDDPAIPGIIDGLNLCPVECVGYTTYSQEATAFSQAFYQHFIADNKVKYCSAESAGCDEFTNLDELERGAEKKEYYINFKICQKPSADDAAYYTWEGSDVTGYQLKAFQLKKSDILDPDPNNSGGYAPCVNLIYGSTGEPICQDENIWDPNNLLSHGFCKKDLMEGNPDCREFYDINGNISYRLLSKTVSVSENCHPYRRTPSASQDDGIIEDDCNNSHGYFNAAGECIYMAIPGEGKTCSASAKGCREYIGNKGNNVRKIINTSNFNDSDTAKTLWVNGSDNKNGLRISSEATFPGGNSLSNTNSDGVLEAAASIIKHQVFLRQNKTYVLSFWAKGIDVSNIGLGTGNSISYSFISNINPPVFNNEWKYYEFGPVFYTGEDSINNLIFNLNNAIYLDNITLKEISDRVYAIEGSWYTPVSCDNTLAEPNGRDNDGERDSPREMLGCQAYKDRFNNNWYLRSFSSLCRLEAVGCEAMIDTFNSDTPFAQTFNSGPDEGAVLDMDVVTVPADEAVYMVNDAKYACQSANKGCQAVGLPLVDQWDKVWTYSTLFIKNNPDRYATDLCKYSQEWCEQFSSSDSTSYFKDPHGKVCVYGQPSGATSRGWYRGNTILPCTTTPNQAFGTGYESLNSKLQPQGPVNNFQPNAVIDQKQVWAGACPDDQSSCTEFIDPLPYIYTNEILEADCNNAAAPPICLSRLKSNTLYSYVLAGDPALTLNVGPADINKCQIRTDDNAGEMLGAGASGRFFYVISTSSDECLINIVKSNSTPFDFSRDIRSGGDKITVAGVYYALKNSVDKASCNGQVDFNGNCVLFNDRSQIDYSIASNTYPLYLKRNYSYLSYDSFRTFQANMPLGDPSKTLSPILSQDRGDSSVILKVSPNRACRNWLSCSTYEKSESNDPNPYFSVNDKCLALENCRSFDENGQCSSFYQAGNELVSSSTRFANNTGYSRPDYMNYAAMSQYGQSTQVVNGNFENGYNNTTEPVGWRVAKVADVNAHYPILNASSWRSSMYRLSNEVINDQEKAKEGISYLRLNAGAAVVSEQIELLPGQTYVLSGQVNTKNLIGEGVTFADIQIRFLDSLNQPIAFNRVAGKDNIINPFSVDSATDEWVSHGSRRIYQYDEYQAAVDAGLNIIRVPSGLGWKQFRWEFKVEDPSIRNLEIALMNVDQSSGSQGLGGYSAWDDLEIKPILMTNGVAVSDSLQRSCRLYPAIDSPSCHYSSGDGTHYGQYGFCLLSDPKNEKQCLQWWPVDTIKGDIVSDYSGYYKERVPLYYCLEKKTIEIDFGSVMSRFGVFGQGADDSGYSSWKLDRYGNQIAVTSFDVPSGWQPLFRYPFVSRFDFDGFLVMVGSTGSKKAFFSTAQASMWRNAVCWGLLGSFFGGNNRIIPNNLLMCGVLDLETDATEDNKDFVCERAEDSEENYSCPNRQTCTPEESDGYPATTTRSRMCFPDGGEEYSGSDICKADGAQYICQPARTGISNLVMEFFEDLVDWLTRGLFGTALSDMRFNEDDRWGGWGLMAFAVEIQIFTFKINLIPWVGMVWHVAQNMQTSILVELLSKVTLENIKPSIMGMKIITDEEVSASLKPDTVDLYPQKGDILGHAYFWNTSGFAGFGDKTGYAYYRGNLEARAKVQYCSKIVRVVTSAGQNKAWTAKLSQNSAYRINDLSDCIINSEDGDISADNDRTPYDLSNCFYQSNYCLAQSFLGKRHGLCENYMGESGVAKDPATEVRLYCNGSEVTSGDGGPRDYNYWCDAGNYIYKVIYAYNSFNYDTDYKPYGSLVAPGNGQYPYDWDTRPDTLGNQPLFYEWPLGSTPPYQSRMGQLYDVPNLKKLFARTYGYWEFDGGLQTTGLTNGRYLDKTNAADGVDYQWSIPVDDCPGPRLLDANCYISPSFTSSTYNLIDGRTIKLSFSVAIDKEQLPITGFIVDWGDGQQTSYGGVSLLSRPQPEAPFVLYHSYDYQTLNLLGVCNNFICNTRVSIRVYDNWNIEGIKNLNINNIKFFQ